MFQCCLYLLPFLGRHVEPIHHITAVVQRVERLQHKLLPLSICHLIGAKAKGEFAGVDGLDGFLQCLPVAKKHGRSVDIHLLARGDMPHPAIIGMKPFQIFRSRFGTEQQRSVLHSHIVVGMGQRLYLYAHGQRHLHHISLLPLAMNSGIALMLRVSHWLAVDTQREAAMRPTGYAHHHGKGALAPHREA